MMTGPQTDEGVKRAGSGVLFGIGATALGVFSASQPLIGVAFYTVAVTGAVLLWRKTGGEKSKIEEFRAASPGDKTLWAVGMASAIGFPILVAADGLGYFNWSGLTAGIGFAVASLYVIFGGFSLLDLYNEGEDSIA
jgi:hypothetical protein